MQEKFVKIVIFSFISTFGGHIIRSSGTLAPGPQGRRKALSGCGSMQDALSTCSRRRKDAALKSKCQGHRSLCFCGCYLIT